MLLLWCPPERDKSADKGLCADCQFVADQTGFSVFPASPVNNHGDSCRAEIVVQSKQKFDVMKAYGPCSCRLLF